MATCAEPCDHEEESGGLELRREIGERLKLTRKALYALELAPKLQKDFAASIGFPGSTYNQVESGKQILTPAQAARIHKRYGISLNWLYVGAEHDLPWKLVDAIRAQRDTSARTAGR